MSPDPSLTAAQEQVLALISAGATATAAAQKAGVHRNTIAAWLRAPEFRRALDRARAAKALLFRDQAESLAAEALAAIRAMITDPAVPAPLRLKAAIAMLDRAVEPIAPSDDPAPEIRASVHKNAQSDAAPPPAEPSPQAPSRPQNPPPSPALRLSRPPAGRNDPCPCGSGVKFKRCCI